MLINGQITHMELIIDLTEDGEHHNTVQLEL